MIIKRVPCGPIDTNAYLLAEKQGGPCAIVDPGVGSFDKLVPIIQSYDFTPDKILLTHSHWDHIAEVSLFKERYNAAVYVHGEDAANVERPGSDGLICRVPIKGVMPDDTLVDGQEITVDGLLFTVIHTPGHSPGGVCFYCPQEQVMISGDTLFKGTIGTLSLTTSQPERMWSSLAKLSTLPTETVVYPGHGPTTTLEREAKQLKREE